MSAGDLVAAVVIIVVAQLWFLTICRAADSEEPKDIQETARSSEDAHEESNDAQPVGAALPASQQHWHPQEKKHRRRENRYWYLSLSVGFIAMIGALAAAGGAILAYQQAVRQAKAAEGQLAEAKQSNRAIIGIYSAALTSAPQGGKSNQIRFSYANSGKGPATNFAAVQYEGNGVQTFFNIDMNDPDTTARLSVNVQKCKTTDASEEDGIVVLPFVPGLSGNDAGDSQSVLSPTPGVPQSVIDKEENMVFAGCFVYRTVDRVHHFAFCFFWNGDPGAWNRLYICPGKGNYAD